MRKVFYQYLSQLFKDNPKLAILLCDIGVFSFKSCFDYDESRIYNLGIMEQSMIGVASGLSKAGFIPFVHSIAPFITERCYEQLKLNLGYENSNVFVVSVGGSYDYTGLGSTHHCPNDLRIVSSIPNFRTYCPGNSKDLIEIINSNLNTGSPKYIRLAETENNLAEINSNYCDLDFLNFNENGICIIIGNSIKDFKKLFDNPPKCSILYTYNISEFDIEKLKIIASCHRKKITLIEPCYDSGILSQIATSIKNIESIEYIGLPKKYLDDFGYGSKEEMDKSLKLDDNAILERLKQIYD